METKRKALSRGLEELFSNERLDVNIIEKKIVDSASKEEIEDISLKDLRSNPYQPRKVFDKDALQELADSIKEHGVFQPIIVKQSIKGYEIIAGERRVKAAEIAGLKTIPAIIRNFTDQQMMEIALLENLQRENLSVIELADAYTKLIDSLNITQEELGKRLGKSRSHITNILGLLRLPDSVKELILYNKITMGHARVLSKLEDNDQIIVLSKEIVEKGLSVRELERLAQSENYKRKTPIQKRQILSSNEFLFLQENLRETLGTKVNITDKKIEIFFSSNQDLNRILEIMKINED